MFDGGTCKTDCVHSYSCLVIVNHQVVPILVLPLCILDNALKPFFSLQKFIENKKFISTLNQSSYDYMFKFKTLIEWCLRFRSKLSFFNSEKNLTGLPQFDLLLLFKYIILCGAWIVHWTQIPRVPGSVAVDIFPWCTHIH